jgi:hypothetical protein
MRIPASGACMFGMPNARFPKFVIQGRTLARELRKAKGISKLIFQVPLFD